MEPLARTKRVRPVMWSWPIHTPISALGSIAAEVLCARARARRLSRCWVTMQHAPNGKKRRVGLVPRSSSSGVEGELRELMREFRMDAMALWRYRVYFGGRM